MALIVAVLSLCSCVEYFEKEDVSSADLLQNLNLKANTSNAKFKNNWWQDYGSDELNLFVAEALRQNLTLSIAKSRVSQARADASLYNAKRYPNVDAGYSSTRSKSDGVVTSAESFSLTPSYSVDLWGVDYSLYHSYENKLVAQEYLAKAAAMTLISEVVSTWLKVKFDQQELKILQEQLELYKSLVKYQLNNFKSGASVDQDILTNQNMVNSFQTRIYQKMILIDSLKLELLYLVGRSPTDDLDIAEGNLPKLIKLPKKGLSSDLINDRPDIRSAWYDLQSADWKLQNIKLQMLPTFNIAVTFSDAALDAVLNNWTSIANTFAVNVMDWGQDFDSVDSQKAVFERSLTQYINTVFKAVVEVRNSLIQNSYLVEQIAWYEKKIKVSNALYREAVLNSEHGGDSISVVYRKINLKNDELILLREKEKLNLRRVNLYNALGGNIW